MLKRGSIALIAYLIILSGLLVRVAQGQDAPPVTPQTPQPDGSIVHIVQPGDTLFAVSLAYGVSVDEIRQLNNLKENARLVIGQRLLIKAASPPTIPPNATVIIVTATHTPGSAETQESSVIVGATSPLPTAPIEAASAEALSTQASSGQAAATIILPLISAGSGICITGYNDKDMNHWRGPDEGLLADIALTLISQSNSKLQAATAGTSASCFPDLQPGMYTIEATPPTGYGLTTPSQLVVEVKAGTRLDLVFGAAEGYQPASAEAPTDNAGQASLTPVRISNVLDTIYNNSGVVVIVVAALILVMGLGTVILAARQR